LLERPLSLAAFPPPWVPRALSATCFRSLCQRLLNIALLVEQCIQFINNNLTSSVLLICKSYKSPAGSFFPCSCTYFQASYLVEFATEHVLKWRSHCYRK
jgi:hypothetical protein